MRKEAREDSFKRKRLGDLMRLWQVLTMLWSERGQEVLGIQVLGKLSASEVTEDPGWIGPESRRLKLENWQTGEGGNTIVTVL